MDAGHPLGPDEADDAEVRQACPHDRFTGTGTGTGIGAEQDVCRFDVTVHHRLGVDIAQGVGHLNSELSNLRFGQASIAKLGGEVGSVDQFHD
jgi:hypothetical protein